MPLYDDLKSLPKIWKESGPAFKLLVVLSGFTSLAPIANLSKTIVEYRGFVRDAIDFYNAKISIPLHTYFESDGFFQTTPEIVDLFVLIFILNISWARYLIFDSGFRAFGFIYFVLYFSSMMILRVGGDARLYATAFCVFVFFALFKYANGEGKILLAGPISLAFIMLPILAAISKAFSIPLAG